MSVSCLRERLFRKEGSFMQFEEREFLPVILGADITAYSLARSFHEEYRIKSLFLSMYEGGYIENSDIIENRVFPGLEKK